MTQKGKNTNVSVKSNQTKSKQNNNKSKYTTFIVMTVIAVLAIGLFIASQITKDTAGTAGSSQLSSSANKTVTDNDLVIQLSDVTEQADFYPVEIGGTKLEVLTIKASDGSIRTAFNTCQVCYSSGNGYYKQEGNVLVCQNCGNRFSANDVEVTRGGCNPVPITSENKIVSETSITISKDFLTEAKAIFANWKS